jgi:hypothetical protein
LARHGLKERLRMLLKHSNYGSHPRSGCRLADFYDTAIDAAMPETTRLAKAIQAWWPAILAPLTTRCPTPETRRLQPSDQATKQVGCGSRNTDNYQRLILPPSR